MISNKDVMAQTDLTLSKQYINVEGFYFVVAHTNNGTRFYSDPIATLVLAEQKFNEYIDVLDYFSGGNIQIYKINKDDFDVIAYINI